MLAVRYRLTGLELYICICMYSLSIHTRCISHRRYITNTAPNPPDFGGYFLFVVVVAVVVDGASAVGGFEAFDAFDVLLERNDGGWLSAISCMY